MCCDAHTTWWNPFNNYGRVCSDCASFGWIWAVVGLVIAAIFFFAFWLPGWLEMKKKHEEFDRNWPKQGNDFPGR
jgi:hypothetical protein